MQVGPVLASARRVFQPITTIPSPLHPPFFFILMSYGLLPCMTPAKIWYLSWVKEGMGPESWSKVSLGRLVSILFLQTFKETFSELSDYLGSFHFFFPFHVLIYYLPPPPRLWWWILISTLDIYISNALSHKETSWALRDNLIKSRTVYLIQG